VLLFNRIEWCSREEKKADVAAGQVAAYPVVGGKGRTGDLKKKEKSQSRSFGVKKGRGSTPSLSDSGQKSKKKKSALKKKNDRIDSSASVSGVVGKKDPRRALTLRRRPARWGRGKKMGLRGKKKKVSFFFLL